jgi:branched-chain amino acid transport system substrate-binding protein
MMLERRALTLGGAAWTTLPFAGRRSARAQAADAGTIRLGVLTDISGPFADLAGQGSVLATRQAAQEAAAALGL